MDKPKPNKLPVGKSLYDRYSRQEMPGQKKKLADAKKREEVKQQRIVDAQNKEQARIDRQTADNKAREDARLAQIQEASQERRESRPVNFGVVVTKRAPYPNADPYRAARQVTMVLVGFYERCIRLTQESAAWVQAMGVKRVRLRVVERHGGVLMMDVTPCQLFDVIKSRAA